MPDPKEMYAIFCGAIDQDTAKSLSNLLAAISIDKADRLHLLFQSTGGFVSEGIFLYNLFRGLPYELWIYNGGQVSSMAALAFQGAKRRFVAEHARFMFHQATQNVQLGTVAQLGNVVDSLAKDNERVESILHEHLKLTEDLWQKHKTLDLNFTAEEAVTYGAADEIKAFQVPLGVQIFRPMQH
jgi:ATP-dependent protease ClpP protease subunit